MDMPAPFTTTLDKELTLSRHDHLTSWESQVEASMLKKSAFRQLGPALRNKRALRAETLKCVASGNTKRLRLILATETIDLNEPIQGVETLLDKAFGADNYRLIRVVLSQVSLDVTTVARAILRHVSRRKFYCNEKSLALALYRLHAMLDVNSATAVDGLTETLRLLRDIALEHAVQVPRSWKLPECNATRVDLVLGHYLSRIVGACYYHDATLGLSNAHRTEYLPVVWHIVMLQAALSGYNNAARALASACTDYYESSP